MFYLKTSFLQQKSYFVIEQLLTKVRQWG